MKKIIEYLKKLLGLNKKAGFTMISKACHGFTMIELLIVIAVLGVLAVAVLSAINPIEQINRGRDTGSRSDAEQLLSAFDRYYTTQEIYPWQNSGAVETSQAIPLVADDLRIVDMEWLDESSTADPTVLEKLTAGGTAELKESFINRIDSLAETNKLRAYSHGIAGESVYVCFHPRSGSFKTEATTRCGTNCDGLPEDLELAGCTVICPAGVDANPYICLP